MSYEFSAVSTGRATTNSSQLRDDYVVVRSAPPRLSAYTVVVERKDGGKFEKRKKNVGREEGRSAKRKLIIVRCTWLSRQRLEPAGRHYRAGQVSCRRLRRRLVCVNVLAEIKRINFLFLVAVTPFVRLRDDRANARTKHSRCLEKALKPAITACT